MFGFLKKKLKESINKISQKIKKTSIAEEIPQSVPATALPPEEQPSYIEEELEQPSPPHVPPKEVKSELKSALQKLKAAIIEKKIQEKDIVPILSDVQTSLLEADVALEVSEKIIEDLKTELVGKTIKRSEIESVVRAALRKSIYDILNQDQLDLFELAKKKKPLKIIFLGFNGTGKTTTIAKLGYALKQKGLKPVFAAADTWRAAALEQLQIHASALGIPLIKHKYGADPAAVIYDAIKAATARGFDVVLADTAGRSHANINLMDEMKKIVRVNKPDLKILIVDCLTGNDAVEQAKLFDQAVGVDGIIMTKADVYDKGGAILSTVWAIKKPILYIGTGQNYGDLKKFDPEEIVSSLL